MPWLWLATLSTFAVGTGGSATCGDPTAFTVLDSDGDTGSCLDYGKGTVPSWDWDPAAPVDLSARCHR